MTDSSARPVTGASLARLLDRLEADLREASPAEMDLITQLAAQPMRADTLEALFRLCSLWLRADDAGRAQAVVQGDGPQLAASAAPGEREDTRLHLALARLWLAHAQRDEAAALEALREARQIAQEAGPRLAWRDGGGPIRANAGGYREWRVLSECTDWTLEATLAVFDLRRALDIADPDLAQRHAATEAFYFASRAQALRQAGQTEPARQAAAQAVKALSGATPPQTVDEDDWLRLADAVIEAAPDLYAALAQPITNLTAQWPLPRRREIEIRLARLQARSRHAQGDLTGALALRDRTNYILSPEGNAADDFIEYDLPWLLEAGRDDDSGRRAFFHIYEAARYMRRDVPSIVHERLADEASRSVWWPLCVIRACHAVDTLERFLGPDPAALPARSPVHARLFAALAKQTDIAAALPAIFAAARQLADERSPGHLWIKRVTAVHDQEQGRIDAATLLEILEATAAAGHMRDRRTWYGIVEERIKVKGLEQALQYPPPVLESGLACYFFVVFLEDFVDAELEKLSETQRSRLHDAWKNISRAVYEDGLTRMARFFETGQGHPGDASLHLYSMMCNNLSIIYRDECKRYEDAIALHRNGIEVSSFAEHYSGIFWSLKYILDDAQDLKPEAKKALMAKIVSAGEDLWQYALAHGYSRHNPNNYTTWVGYYLYRLDRDGEIPLWLERLVQWQEGEDGENPAHLSDVALQRRMGFFSYMHHANRDAAETLWAAMKPQVVASKDEYTHYVISRDLQIYFNRPAEAIAFFEKHLELNPRKTEEQREQAQEIEQRLAECRSLAAPAPRARWRFWK